MVSRLFPFVGENKVVNQLFFCYTIFRRTERSASAMEQMYTIDQIQSIVSPIAKAHGVSSVALFGSYATGKAGKDSDVDLKIEKGKVRSLFQICGLRLALEDALKLPVDLVTTESSDKAFLESIEKEEVLLYREA